MLTHEVRVNGGRVTEGFPHTLMEEREPLPWLGDIMQRSIAEAMKRVTAPVFTGVTQDGEQRWWRERLTITDLGRQVLAASVDWLSLRPPERWVEGVCIRPGAPNWRWDETVGMPILA